MLYVHEFMHIQRFFVIKKPHGASGFVWKFLILCSNKKPHFAQGFVWKFLISCSNKKPHFAQGFVWH